MPIEESSYRQAGLEAGQVRVPVLPELSQFGPELQRGMTDPLAAAGQQGGKVYNENFFGDKGLALANMGPTLTRTLTPAATAIALIGQTSFNTWHDGVESIRVQTGALGKELDGLAESMEDVGERVTQPLSEIGDTLGYVTNKTELTGQPLEDLTTRLAHLSDLTDSELRPSTETYLKLFGAWRVETGEMADTLDYFYRASQVAGRGPEELASDVLNARSVLQGLGFDLEESVALSANFGGSFTKLYGGMRIAVSQLSEENRNVPKAFAESIESIEDAGSAAAANRKAIELFGSRAGPELAHLIREGKFSLADFNAELSRNQSGIEDTYGDMRTLGDRLAELRNKVAGFIGGAGQPIATVATIVAGVGPSITGFSKLLGPPITRLRAVQAAAALAGEKLSLMGAASDLAIMKIGKMSAILAVAATAWKVYSSERDEGLTADEGRNSVVDLAEQLRTGTISLEDYIGPLGDLARSTVESSDVMEVWREGLKAADKIGLKNIPDMSTNLDDLGGSSVEAAQKIKKFAGLSGAALKTWKIETTDSLATVDNALADLAGQAHLSSREILRSFRKEAIAVAEMGDNLQTLAKQGYSETFTQKLSEMGTEGTIIADRLANTHIKMRDKIKGALGDIETAEKHYTDFTRLYLEEKAPRSVSTGFQKMFGAAGAFALGFERAISAVRTDVGLDRLKVSHIAVDFPSWAKGTGDFKEGGLARVGERGEEIVYLPPHSAVIPAHKSREIPSEIRDRIPGYAKGAGDFGSLLSLLYPANDPAHPNHLHYESDSNASAIALAKAIEALKIIPRFIVSELEGFHNRGQISTGHMVGSAHYDGRAGDVNNRAGTSAAEQKDLGNLADWIRNVTSGGTSAFGGGLAALNPRAIVTDALRSVDVPVFPGKLRPVGPSAARQLSKGLFGRAQEWIGDMGMNSALSGSRDVTAAIELGKQMAARKGWVGPEWSALHTLWDYESGWRWWADNPLSSAYGIPQALPGSKMAAAGPDWRTNPATQIDWGLDYIKVRPDYGTPSRALAMWQSRSPHWYHDGGLIPEPVVGFGQRSGDRYHFAKDELVTPGSKVSGGRGIRDVTIHLTINGPTAGDPKKLARFLRGEIIDVLEESEQMNR